MITQINHNFDSRFVTWSQHIITQNDRHVALGIFFWPHAGQESAPHMHVLACICSNGRQFHHWVKIPSQLCFICTLTGSHFPSVACCLLPNSCPSVALAMFCGPKPLACIHVTGNTLAYPSRLLAAVAQLANHPVTQGQGVRKRDRKGERGYQCCLHVELTLVLNSAELRLLVSSDKSVV